MSEGNHPTISPPEKRDQALGLEEISYAPLPDETSSSPVSPLIPEERRKRLYAPVLLPEASQDTREEELLKDSRTDSLKLGGILSDRFEKWLLVLLFVLGTASVIFTYPGMGMSWDEAYYLKAGSTTLTWIEECFSGYYPPIRGDDLDLCWNSYWFEPKGHPSITRFLVALGLSIPKSPEFPLFAMRWPNAVLYGLTLVVLYLLARLHCGRITARIAVAAYICMPRIFGHAHFGLTETPMVFLTVLTVYAFVRGLESRKWAILTGIFFGLALSTKINGLFLPLIVLPWAFLFHRPQSQNNLYSLFFIGPLAMFISWPWLWDQPLTHLAQYVLRNASHTQIGLLFLGKVYNNTTESVPWHYPLTILALTLPLVTLILSTLGVARTLRNPRQQQSVGFLFLWAALLPCLIPIVLGSPQYDGGRLFLPAFPFLAILAGIGGAVLIRIAGHFDHKTATHSRASLVFLAVLGLLILNGAWAFWSVHPYYLTYFNELAGGRKRAFSRFEMTYWGEGLNMEALKTLNNTIPDGASLCPRALNIEVLRYYQLWGWLKNSISLNEDKSADFQLLQYRRGLFGDVDWFLYEDRGEHFKRVATFPPVEDPERDVPLYGLYRTGADFDEKYLQFKEAKDKEEEAQKRSLPPVLGPFGFRQKPHLTPQEYSAEKKQPRSTGMEKKEKTNQK